MGLGLVWLVLLIRPSTYVGLDYPAKKKEILKKMLENLPSANGISTRAASLVGAETAGAQTLWKGGRPKSIKCDKI